LQISILNGNFAPDIEQKRFCAASAAWQRRWMASLKKAHEKTPYSLRDGNRCQVAPVESAEQKTECGGAVRDIRRLGAGTHAG